jgi:uncharacterized Ntn-hydrolase superfamily protein
MKIFLPLLLFFIASAILQGQDTFSITAVDTLTGEVGSAGASCIDATAISQGCYILSDVKPGVGVIHTQAYWNPANQNYASSLMDLGVAPDDMIDSLVANDVQNNPTIRQYGIIDLFEGLPRMAAYTGINCDDYKSHILGPNYTIQGNILLGQQILDSMEARFLATEGELACKLMAALQGANIIGADTRCLDDGVSSLSAFLRVARPLDPPDDLYLDINVPLTPPGVDPIDSLQTLVDAWGGCLVSGQQNPSSLSTHRIFPNPAKNTLYITSVNALKEGCFILFDAQGQKILEKTNCTGLKTEIQMNLQTGLYFYQLTEESVMIGSGKLMIKQ